jgi:hypothetical protein
MLVWGSGETRNGERNGRCGVRRGLSRHGGVPIEVRVDPVRKRRFEALIAEMRQAEKKEAAGFDAYWESVDEVLEKSCTWRAATTAARPSSRRR